MKCYRCGIENKPDAKICRKCAAELVVKPVWMPTWKWHLKVLGIIYILLIVTFFLLNWLLKPYMRKLPHNITPWLKPESAQGSKK
jgi:hypothetical protein